MTRRVESALNRLLKHKEQVQAEILLSVAKTARDLAYEFGRNALTPKQAMELAVALLKQQK